MIAEGWRIYLATRKKNDQLYNRYFMRPLAGFAVAILARTPATPNQVTILNLVVFVASVALLVALPDYRGGLIAIGVLQLSYLFDCADGMLARHKKIASKEGHLFDFFTDEIKALLLVAGLGLRGFRTEGLGPHLQPIPPSGFLFATIAGVIVVASATSLTNFVRRPELTGKETPVEAHYETVEAKRTASPVRRLVELVLTFLRFLNHYPSHIWIFALAGRLELFFWIYAANNLLYLGQGWLGLLLRFGRSRPPTPPAS
jgi:phosphatidylglycerophosphate synthase